jgi:hypothetical protein
VYDTHDSKEWKDNQHIAVITKVNSTYIGRSINYANLESPSSASLPVVPCSTSSQSNSPPILSTENPIKIHKSKLDQTKISINNNEITNSSTTSSCTHVETELYGKIAVQLKSKGLDKLIHLQALLEPSINTSNNGLEDDQIESLLSNLSFSFNESLRSQKEITKSNSNLNSTISNKNEYVDSFPSHLLHLRSKQPRKVISRGKNMYSVSFSKEGRVRSPSRKNLVIDIVNNNDITNEWLDETDLPPILQLGKMSEDTFALDFWKISPFQAFTMALAAFDQ